MKLMLLVIGIGLSIISCKGSDKGTTAAAVDATVGTWYYISPASTATVEQGLIAYVYADGTYNSLSYKATKTNGVISAFVRKKIGKYVKSGDSFTITYSYETCTPINSETFTAAIAANSNDQLNYVNADKTVAASFIRSTGGASDPVNITLVEDTACNKM